MENKRVLTVDDLIKRNLNYTTIGNTDIKIRIFISINTWEEYNKSFEETKDYRIAFIKMLMSMTRINGVENNNISYIKLEEIQDDELLKVMDEIIHKEKYIQEYFTNKNCSASYEDFYNAYKYQNEKLGEIIKESIKPLIDSMAKYGKQVNEIVANNVSFKNLFVVPKINIPSFKYPQLNSIFNPILSENTDYVEQYDLAPEVLSLHSQEDVVDDIITANKDAQHDTEILSGILSAIKEGQESQKKSEQSSRRLSIYTITIAVFSLFIAVMSFVGLGNISNAFKKVFGI